MVDHLATAENGPVPSGRPARADRVPGIIAGARREAWRNQGPPGNVAAPGRLRLVPYVDGGTDSPPKE
ncbi:hypothetical protein C6376_29040 [Streptomyces sp. P3]|nr:hypothetical protein C6376_29040 [Streptomyces sp. P3]